MPLATITIGRDTRDGGWAEESITVSGSFRVGPGVKFDPTDTESEYEVTDFALVDGAGLVTDPGDLSESERQRADEALIAAFERENARAA